MEHKKESSAVGSYMTEHRHQFSEDNVSSPGLVWQRIQETLTQGAILLGVVGVKDLTYTCFNSLLPNLPKTALSQWFLNLLSNQGRRVIRNSVIDCCVTHILPPLTDFAVSDLDLPYSSPVHTLTQ